MMMTDPETIHRYSVELQEAQALNAELLEALKNASDTIRSGFCSKAPFDLLNEMEAAIAKAETVTSK